MVRTATPNGNSRGGGPRVVPALLPEALRDSDPIPPLPLSIEGNARSIVVAERGAILHG